jgi:hypothetical protein
MTFASQRSTHLALFLGLLAQSLVKGNVLEN